MRKGEMLKMMPAVLLAHGIKLFTVLAELSVVNPCHALEHIQHCLPTPLSSCI